MNERAEEWGVSRNRMGDESREGVPGRGHTRAKARRPRKDVGTSTDPSCSPTHFFLVPSVFCCLEHVYFKPDRYDTFGKTHEMIL